MGGGSWQPWSNEAPGPRGPSVRPGSAIPCRVAPQQSPTPFHRARSRVVGWSAASQKAAAQRLGLSCDEIHGIMETTDPESVLELSDEFQGPVAGEHIGNGVFLTGVSVAVVDLATALEVTADFFQAGPGDLSLTYTVEGASGVYQANVVVPEASSLAMLCTGCLGLLCLTARRRRCGPA